MNSIRIFNINLSHDKNGCTNLGMKASHSDSANNLVMKKKQRERLDGGDIIYSLHYGSFIRY